MVLLHCLCHLLWTYWLRNKIYHFINLTDIHFKFSNIFDWLVSDYQSQNERKSSFWVTWWIYQKFSAMNFSSFHVFFSFKLLSFIAVGLIKYFYFITILLQLQLYFKIIFYISMNIYMLHIHIQVHLCKITSLHILYCFYLYFFIFLKF